MEVVMMVAGKAGRVDDMGMIEYTKHACKIRKNIAKWKK